MNTSSSTLRLSYSPPEDTPTSTRDRPHAVVRTSPKVSPWPTRSERLSEIWSLSSFIPPDSSSPTRWQENSSPKLSEESEADCSTATVRDLCQTTTPTRWNSLPETSSPEQTSQRYRPDAALHTAESISISHINHSSTSKNVSLRCTA